MSLHVATGGESSWAKAVATLLLTSQDQEISWLGKGMCQTEMIFAAVSLRYGRGSHAFRRSSLWCWIFDPAASV